MAGWRARQRGVVSQGHHWVEATAGFHVCHLSSGIQVGGILKFHLCVVLVVKVVLLRVVGVVPFVVGLVILIGLVIPLFPVVRVRIGLIRPFLVIHVVGLFHHVVLVSGPPGGTIAFTRFPVVVSCMSLLVLAEQEVEGFHD